MVDFSFKLKQSFIDKYAALPEPFGYNGLGKVVFYRTYSRKKKDGSYESWADVCERVINAMYSVQKDHCSKNSLPWSDDKAVASAEEAYDRLFNLKWSPSGRGLWMLGSEFVHNRKISESLLNCAFLSTKDISTENGKIFNWFMEMMMLGVGVGSDVRGAGTMMIYKPSKYAQKVFIVPDSREGWAESVEVLFNSYTRNDYPHIKFDYSLIRAEGAPIEGFGGVSSGKAPLVKLHDRMRASLDKNTGDTITTETIADIFNQIGACVIAGNVRRAAIILLGEPDDKGFLSLKDYNINPQRSEWSWSSNNSVIADVGQDYTDIADGILLNGEPGVVWLGNAQKFGRMGELKHDSGTGTNPCGEVILESSEMCNLVEIYMNRHEDEYDYQRTLKFAYLYGKTITLMYDWIKDDKTRTVMNKNRRVGLSNTGVAQFVSKYGIAKFVEWLDNGYSLVKQYDNRYSTWLKIPKSIRLTTSKPSGSISLLSGSTPGVHYPRSEYYIRRVRLAANSPMIDPLVGAGFHIEPDKYSDNTVVIEFPIHAGENIKSVLDVSIWEQMALAALVQKYWSDNSVSVTVSFDPEKVKSEEIKDALDYYQYQLKSISMLPEPSKGAYEQMPYEAIDKEKYYAIMEGIDLSRLETLRESMTETAKLIDSYCDGEACAIELPKPAAE